MEKTNKGAISEQKLKVVYLPAEGGSTNNQGIPEEEEAGEASRVEEPVSGGMFPRETDSTVVARLTSFSATFNFK